MLSNEKRKPIQGNSITVVNNQVILDAKNPIPISVGGNSFYIGGRSKKYIPFIGDDNFPSLLLEARLTSPTQNSCVSSIAASALGNGILVTNEGEPDEQLFEWMKSVNNERESLDDVILSTFDGERGMGTQFIEVVKGAIAKVPYMKVYTHSLLHCRFGEEDPDTGYPTHCIVSKKFAGAGYISAGKLSEARAIPIWSPNKLDQDKCWFEDEKGDFHTILVMKNKVAGIEHYGLPASIASLRQQVLEARGAQYNIDNFDNNMILGGILMFKSAMTEQEAQKTARKIFLSHIGEGKTGRIAVVSSENGLEDVKFEKYETNKDGSFIEQNKELKQTIIEANNWNGAFFGSNKSGGLGNSGDYIRQAWDTAEATLLNPMRRKVIDKVIVPIMRIYSEVFNKKEILDYEFWFNSAKPYSFLTQMDPETFTQVNEARDAAGLPNDDSKENVYLSEMRSKAKTPADVQT